MTEKPFLKIALIGAGNVATHLGTALKNAGHNIEFVFNRNSERGIMLAEKLSAHYVSGIKSINDSDLMILAVSDDSIPLLSLQLSGCNYPIIHTSGTVSKDVLSIASPDYGVFYPLQTFSFGREVNFSKVPICLDSSNSVFTGKLERLANSISGTVSIVSEQKRKILHLAGMFACNFTNYMYSIADDILKENDISMELLLPLIQETANKIQTITPFDAQTGPARRGDISTIQEHLLLIQDKPELLEIYKLVTNNILKKYSPLTSTLQFP